MGKIKLKNLIKEAFEGMSGVVTTPVIGNMKGSYSDNLLSEKEIITEATRWNVAIELPNGKVTAVYGHYDGYPQWVGKILKKHYTNPSKIKQLIKLGKNGISTLDKEIKGGKGHSFDSPDDGETVFYGRDRGEKGNMSATYKNREEYGRKFGEEFGYVWSIKDKKWSYFDYRGKEKTL